MSKLSSTASTLAQDLFVSSAVAQQELGEIAFAVDGRKFRYARAGAAPLVAGTLLQSPAEVVNHENLIPAITAIGATQVTVTLGATAATTNQYADGFLIVTVTPGQGYSYKISSHPAAIGGATLVLTLEDPLLVALTASSRIDLVANQFSAMIINPAAASSTPKAVALYPLPATYYGWVQVEGAACLLADGAITVGTALVASNGTAGAVEALAGVQAPVGTAITGIATTEYGLVDIKL